MKKTIKILKEFVIEANLSFKEDGIYIREMDLANVCMFDIFIPCKHQVCIDKNVGINTNDLYKSLEEKNNAFKIEENFLIVNNVKIPILELDYKEQKKPEIIFTSKVIFSSLLKFKKEIIKFDNEGINLVCTKDEFSLEQEKRTTIIEKNRMFKSVFSDNDGNTSKYSLEYLGKFLKALPYDKGTLQFAKDMPLLFSLKTDKGIKIDWILAPRIEND